MALQRNNASGPLAQLTKGVSGLIGLAIEVHAHSKAQKAVGQASAPAVDASIPKDQNEPPADGDATDGGQDVATGFVDRPLTIQPLPLPIILPQRRPKSKTRGFVRAYAPDLGQYKGISQETFLTFLKDFHKSSQASPVFQVINVAALAAGFAPSMIAMAVSTAVMAASSVAIEVQGRVRTNNFLDKANEELFHPKNLHCMIMTFRPDAPENTFMDFNVTNGALSSVPAPLKLFSSLGGPSESRMGRKLRKSDGTTVGELAMPQAAALVFPALPRDTDGSTTSEDSDEGTDGRSSAPRQASSWKETRKFISDYKDRRAQAEFAGRHGQDSRLAIPGATAPGQFASKFSDPNHPVNSGSPLALLTGGTVSSANDIKAKLTGRQQSPSPKDEAIEGRRRGIIRQRGVSKGLLGGTKGTTGQDVLYLLIAEMPSQEEMAQLAGETD